MVRSIKWSIVILLFFSVIYPRTAQAQGIEPVMDSKAAMVIDSQTGQILFQQDENVMVQVGSISKLLAIYVVMSEMQKRDDIDGLSTVPISDVAYRLSQNYEMGNVPLRQDFQYTANELIESVAVNVANGSLIALAEWIAGSEQGMLEMMDAQLKAWELTDYKLLNVTGLPADTRQTASDSTYSITPTVVGQTNAFSAEVMAVVAYHLVNEFPEFVDYTKQSKAIFKGNTDDAITMSSYNQMLAGKEHEYQGVEGLMAGSSDQEGYSFVGFAHSKENQDFGVITLVMGTAQDGSQYAGAAELFDYVWRAYRQEIVAQAGQRVQQLGAIAVEGGEEPYLSPSYGSDLRIVVPIVDTTPRLTYDFIPIEEPISAPVESGQTIGKMKIYAEGTQADFIPKASGNNVALVQMTTIKEAAWYVQAWQTVSHSVGEAWKGTRRFFVDLFN